MNCKQISRGEGDERFIECRVNHEKMQTERKVEEENWGEDFLSQYMVLLCSDINERLLIVMVDDKLGKHGTQCFSSDLSITSCSNEMFCLHCSHCMYSALYFGMIFFSLPLSLSSLLRLPTSETSSHNWKRSLEIHLLWTVKMTNLSQLFG